LVLIASRSPAALADGAAAAAQQQRVSLIVIRFCLSVCLSVCLDVRRPRQRQCPPAAPADSAAAALRSSSKVKAGQWVTPNPTLPTIFDRIC